MNIPTAKWVQLANQCSPRGTTQSILLIAIQSFNSVNAEIIVSKYFICIKDQLHIMHWTRVAISFSRGSSWLRDWTCISCLSCIGRQILSHWATWENLVNIEYLLRTNHMLCIEPGAGKKIATLNELAV